MAHNVKKEPHLVKFINNHLLNKEKTEAHRLTTGFTIMFIGVSLTKVVLVYDSEFIHLMADLVGYMLHGLGAIPFIDIFFIQE